MGNLVHDFGPSLVVVIGFIAQALILHGRRGNDLKALSEWRERHEQESKKRDQAISELKQIAASMKATAQGQDRRLEMLEERKAR